MVHHDPRPVFIILAGPDGAGKSTTAARLLPPDFPFVNAHEIAKTLPSYPSSTADLEAGRIALERMDDLASRGASFAVETTLAGRTFAARARHLQSLGFHFRLFFVYAPDPEFCIRRVAARVGSGGHDIPSETVRRRYHSGVRNFVKLYLPIADEWWLVRNANEGGIRIIAAGGTGVEAQVSDPVRWELILRASS